MTSNNELALDFFLHILFGSSDPFDHLDFVVRACPGQCTGLGHTQSIGGQGMVRMGLDLEPVEQTGEEEEVDEQGLPRANRVADEQAVHEGPRSDDAQGQTDPANRAEVDGAVPAGGARHTCHGWDADSPKVRT